MTRAFTEIAFTPSVRDVQVRRGSRDRNLRLEQVEDRGDRLTAIERAFIAARDSFYQATVGESGWPYVQFRGGPPGFLKVIDESTLAYADFRGNVQYLSAGNLAADPRVSLILMDYRERRRLKVWGRARLVDEAAEPRLSARVRLPGYAARVEGVIAITVVAFDWNCPQHITRRFTEAEVEQAAAPLLAELETLRARVAPVGPESEAS